MAVELTVRQIVRLMGACQEEAKAWENLEPTAPEIEEAYELYELLAKARTVTLTFTETGL